jgi:hypothetical protein
MTCGASTLGSRVEVVSEQLGVDPLAVEQH